MQEQIERYIGGELSLTEIDDLWIEFLKNPYWYEYYLNRIHLIALSGLALSESKNEGGKNISLVTSL